MTREISQAGDQAHPQVFVSYASADAEQVIAIVRLLEKEGITIWRDGDRILGGQSWGAAVVHGIAHCEVFMLMCSPNSLQSRPVQHEVWFAWERRRPYLPVWVSPVTEVPDEIQLLLRRDLHWIDTHTQPPERWLPQLLSSLRAMGVKTKDVAHQPGDPAPEPRDPSVAAAERGLRFKPGDRPVKGADWELEQLLGKGGFGEVWRAKNPDLPGLPPVALKFCLQLDDRSKGLLRHEAEMVLHFQKQFHGSPSGIVPLVDAYLNNDPPCLRYPYIEGGTLVRLIDECREAAGSLKPAQAQQIVQRVAQIVSAAHRATPKLVHRDLKPSNILVERRGDGKMVLRVTDFGIGGLAAQPLLERSRSTSLSENMASVLTGSYSPLYASPQQMRGDKPDPRDDVYALGVIWYQLLTGDLTSPAPTGRRWADELRRKGMSDEALDLLSSCFETNPDHRPSDAGHLAELLAALPLAKSREDESAFGGSGPDRQSGAIKREGEAPSEPAFPLVGRGSPDPAPIPDRRSPGQDAARPSAAADRHPGVVGRGSPDPAPIPDRRSPGQDAARPSAAADRPPRTAQPQPAVTRTDDSQHSGFKLKVAAGLLGLAALLGIVLYIATDNGTVKITGSDSRMKISIDGNDVTIENLGKPIRFWTGTHQIEADYDGVRFKTDSFQIRRGEETVLDVTYKPKADEVGRSKPEPPNPPENAPAHVENNPAPSAPTAKPPVKSQPEQITTRVGEIKLRLIPAGTFSMGSPDGQGETDEHPEHQVRITRPFYLGVTEVTRGRFRLFVDETGYTTEAKKDGKGGYGWNEETKKFEQGPKYTWQNPGFEQTDEHPVVNVSWNDTQAFIAWLSQKEGKTFRLPTEAEWEYACRAGTKTAYVSGDDPKALAVFGNIEDGTANEKDPAWPTTAARNGFVYTAPAGRFRANAFGLYDMHGNVWEWCQDRYGVDYYKESPAEDPPGPSAASDRVFRGGGWYDNPRDCRSARRRRFEPAYRSNGLGFRLALGQSGG